VRRKGGHERTQDRSRICDPRTVCFRPKAGATTNLIERTCAPGMGPTPTRARFPNPDGPIPPQCENRYFGSILAFFALKDPEPNSRTLFSPSLSDPAASAEHRRTYELNWSGTSIGIFQLSKTMTVGRQHDLRKRSGNHDFPRVDVSKLTVRQLVNLLLRCQGWSHARAI